MSKELTPHYSEDFFANAQSAMDDWHYEMRREIQEIVVSCCTILFFSLDIRIDDMNTLT